MRRDNEPTEQPSEERGEYYERQRAEECGLCALRNVLAPHRGAKLPSWPSLVLDARALEVGEEALIRNEEQRTTSRRKRGSLSDCNRMFSGWSCCNVCTEDSEEGLERADEDGNFSVEVLMRAASRQQINGQPVVMEYWGGRHRAAAKGRELGFILCSGDHWWCIRRCSEKLDRWEEVDSLEEQIGRTWSTDEGLREDLARSRDTVLVLYTATDSQSTSFDSASGPEGAAEETQCNESEIAAEAATAR